MRTFGDSSDSLQCRNVGTDLTVMRREGSRTSVSMLRIPGYRS